jgi:hypothetical protein
MKRFDYLLNLTLVLSIAVLSAGCGQSDGPPPDDAVPAPSNEGGSSTTTDAGVQPNAEIAATLARLSDEDRALAEKQVNCPVSGQPLGSMGPPVKVTVKGRDVLLCCQGCEGSIQEEPDKYLVKLPE